MKKINSEIKFNDAEFAIKIGTTDKKNPETIYVELGTYITPNISSMNFANKINFIEKTTKQYITRSLSDNHFCGKDFIFLTDVATDRMKEGKKSFFEAQLFLKPTKESLNDNKKSFKDISDKIKSNYLDGLILFIKKSMTEESLSYSKTKK